MKALKKPFIKKVLFIIAIIIVIVILGIIIINGRHYFSRRNIRQIGMEIGSFGILSPLVVIFLVFLSTIIPPLPLPVPLIEIASGALFGFGYGFFIVWISQMISSLIAFKAARALSKRFFGRFLNNKIWNSYRTFISKKGALAVFIIRLTLAAPFNIISYLSGLTDMKTGRFLLATALGTIPEALIFSFVGSELRNIHIRLWYLFIAIIILGVMGTIATILIINNSNKKSK